MTSPEIYNKIRTKKRMTLEGAVTGLAMDIPVLVGCPSCKVGISRTFLQMQEKRPVLHTLEYLVEHIVGPDWKKQVKHHLAATRARNGLRIVSPLSDAINGNGKAKTK